MAITKELIDGLLVTIQNLYLADDIPWMIDIQEEKIVQPQFNWYG